MVKKHNNDGLFFVHSTMPIPQRPVKIIQEEKKKDKILEKYGFWRVDRYGRVCSDRLDIKITETLVGLLSRKELEEYIGLCIEKKRSGR